MDGKHGSRGMEVDGCAATCRTLSLLCPETVMSSGLGYACDSIAIPGLYNRNHVRQLRIREQETQLTRREIGTGKDHGSRERIKREKQRGGR